MPKNVVVEIGVDGGGASSHVSGPSPTSPSRADHHPHPPHHHHLGANGRYEDPEGLMHEKIGALMSHLTAKDVMNIPRAGQTHSTLRSTLRCSY